jgi:hypothetical protein
MPRRARVEAGSPVISSDLQKMWPAVGFSWPGDQVEIGGLASAVRADDGGQRSGLEGAAHGVDRDMPAEANRQVAGFEKRHQPSFRGGRKAEPGTHKRRRSWFLCTLSDQS